MTALSLRSGRLMLLALLASALGTLLLAPAALAQSPDCDQYGGGAGPNDPCATGGNTPSGPGAGSSPGGSSADGTLLGPDSSVSPAGEGASGGVSDPTTGSGSSDGGSSDGRSSDDGSFDGGTSSNSADDKASKAGRSVGEILSGGTERVASAKPAARAAKAVSEDGGGAGLLWLLLALGAVTAVAAGGVAVRRRQARQGYLR